MLRVLRKRLVRLPTVDPPPDQVSLRHKCNVTGRIKACWHITNDQVTLLLVGHTPEALQHIVTPMRCISIAQDSSFAPARPTSGSMASCGLLAAAAQFCIPTSDAAQVGAKDGVVSADGMVLPRVPTCFFLCKGAAVDCQNRWMQVEPSSEMRKVLQAASKLQKKKGDSYLGVSSNSKHCTFIRPGRLQPSHDTICL